MFLDSTHGSAAIVGLSHDWQSFLHRQFGAVACRMQECHQAMYLKLPFTEEWLAIAACHNFQ